jgi:hypothetical protein
MASQYDININIDVESATLGELEAELQRINSEIKKIPPNTKEFNKAAANVKTLSGEVDKANSKLQKVDVGQLVGDFAKVGAAIGAVGAAFSAFGDEGSATNEAVQKALQRTQAVLALVAVAEAAVSAARLASAAATKIYTVAQNALNTSIQAGTVSLKGLKTALAGTGIGLLVVALGLVVAYFDDIKNFINGGETAKYTKEIDNQVAALQRLNLELEKQLVVIDKNKNAGQDEITNLQARITAFQDYAAKSEVAIQAQLKAYRDLARENGKLTDEEEAARQQLFIDLVKNQNNIILAQKEFNNAKLRQLDDANSDEIALLRAQGKDTTEEEKANLRERLTLLKSFGDAYLEEVKRTEAQISILEANEERERKRAREQAAKERRDKIKSELDELAGIIADEPTEAIARLGDEQARALSILEKYAGGSKDITKIIAELDAQGLTPLANQFRRLTDEANYEEFSRLINKYYGEAISNVYLNAQGTLGDFSNLVSTFPKIIEQRFTEDFRGINLFRFAEEDFFEFTRTLEDGLKIIVRDPLRTIVNENTFVDAIKSAKAFIQLQEEIGSGIRENAEIEFIKVDPVEIEQSLAFVKTIQSNLLKDLQEQFTKQQEAILTGPLTDEARTKQLADLFLAYQAAYDEILKTGQETNRQIFQSAALETEILSRASQRDITERLSKLETRYVGWKGFLASINDDIRKEERELQLELLQGEEDRIAKEKVLVEQQYAEGLISREEYLLALQDLEDQAASVRAETAKVQKDEDDARLEAVKLFYDTAIGLLQAYNDLVASTAELESAQYDVRIAQAQKNLDLQLEGIDNEEERLRIQAQGEAEIAALRDEQTRKEAEAAKRQANLTFAITIGEIIANTANGVMKSFAQLGPIAGAIAAIGVTAIGAIQIANANKARQAAIAGADAALAGIGGGGELDQRTQFAEGGLVSGPGTGTSDSISARLSNGEYVVNAASTRQFLPILDQINNNPQRFANGGMVTTTQTDPNLVALLGRIEQRLATPPKAYVVSSEIQAGINTEEYLQRRSQLT